MDFFFQKFHFLKSCENSFNNSSRNCFRNLCRNIYNDYFWNCFCYSVRNICWDSFKGSDSVPSDIVYQFLQKFPKEPHKDFLKESLEELQNISVENPKFLLKSLKRFFVNLFLNFQWFSIFSCDFFRNYSKKSTIDIFRNYSRSLWIKPFITIFSFFFLRIFQKFI